MCLEADLNRAKHSLGLLTISRFGIGPSMKAKSGQFVMAKSIHRTATCDSICRLMKAPVTWRPIVAHLGSTPAF
ncbi:hypothetical protein Pla52n_68800 [Stieleria varia]|uniref:Uncharacterized protein n=1 Tax=Stieleria varia TaxID=2528005 RepID=A0A5C5ZPX9_9BACT|nr:hypothetical protein Pla52n_68800 [Stieleria varia]